MPVKPQGKQQKRTETAGKPLGETYAAHMQMEVVYIIQYSWEKIWTQYETQSGELIQGPEI